MKIGILTLPFNNNYGGYLQACALYEVLKGMGHDVILINRRTNNPSLIIILKWLFFEFLSFLNIRDNPLLLDAEKIYKYKGRLMIPFVDKIIRRKTKELYTHSSLQKLGIEFDAIVVGSDQVWRPEYVPGIEEYMLDFTTNREMIRIAYAVSFGTASPLYTDSQIQNCRNLINHFSGIGLREKSGLSVLEKFEWKTTKNLQVVVDPTMLLNVDYYKCLISNIGITITDKKVISTYILDKDKIADDIIYKISRCLGLHCVDIIDSKHWKEKDYIMPSIEEWLARIANSTFVITDSFHGTVFSIIFNTPFIVKVNRTRGRDRFETLLGYFDLQYRMVDDDKTALEIVEEKIEWSEVNAKLKDLRNRGCKFLYETLSK